MVTPISAPLQLRPTLEPTSPVPPGTAVGGSTALTAAPAEEPAAPAAEDLANAFLLATAHYGDAAGSDDTTLSSVLSALGSHGV